jgi:hypothetical protein
MKNKLLVSFSGGETSAFMSQWLWNNKRDEYDIIFVFANTGQENEETLQFVDQCSIHFGFPVVWVEAVVHHNQRKANTHKIVNYVTASRNGEPFEEIIKKHGIPNMSTPHCTRELKQAPIKSYAKSLGWKDYYLAIGIRIDEIDRMNAKRVENKIIYPLISDIKMTKQKINFWFDQQPFRLLLKGYQGNCVTCWKKSDSKLYQIARESQYHFIFFDRMEQKYGDYIPESRLKLLKERGDIVPCKTTFFRKNRSAMDIINESKINTKMVIDDSVYIESCDLFSECGIDN